MDRLSPLASVAATRAVLDAHGLATKKSLGQNFLINDDVLKRIVGLADIQPSDGVLEVGPGVGTLTIALLKNAGYVVSIERDADLWQVLPETTAPWQDRFALIRKDALDVSEEDVASAVSDVEASGAAAPGGEALDGAAAFGGETSDGAAPGEGESNGMAPGGEAPDEKAPDNKTPDEKAPDGTARALPNKFVANLPYAVAATVVLGYFQQFAWLDSATVMVQKEVADRMAATPGTKNYGAYTVKLGLCAQPAGRFLVGPGNFFPPPHVDSAVIRLDRRTPEAVARTAQRCGTSEAELVRATCTMADAAFANRRKTLSNSCKTHFAGRGEEGARIVEALPQLFERAGVDAKRRGETLTQDEFVALGAAYLQIIASAC